jgi:hypothetical protein
MIICHRHRFIFIKTRKTAGSSIEIALSRACGEGDIVTPLSVDRGEEELRRSEGGVGPANYRKPVAAHRGIREWRRLLLRGQRASWGPHTTAGEVRGLVGEDTWNRYLKLSVERNPWERALSRYWWQRQRWEEKNRQGFPALSEYLAWLEMHKPHWISNWSHYAIGETIAVDRVLLYEDLRVQLRALENDLGLETDRLQLPEKRAKGGFRQDTRPYQELLSNADRDRIARLCHREIAAFGYQF